MGRKNKRLTVNAPAPDFTAELWDGSTFQLSSLYGEKIWLAFFRYASCPLCNLRVHQMIQQFKMFQKSHLSIVSVFQSPQESISEYVGKQKPPFPLVSDPDEKLYSLYGLDSSVAGFFHPGNLPLLKQAFQLGFKIGKTEGSVTRIPADFLIDQKGIIREVYYGNKIGDHIPMENVIRFAKAP